MTDREALDKARNLLIELHRGARVSWVEFERAALAFGRAHLAATTRNMLDAGVLRQRIEPALAVLDELIAVCDGIVERRAARSTAPLDGWNPTPCRQCGRPEHATCHDPTHGHSYEPEVP